MVAPKFKSCLVDGCEGNASYHAQGSLGYCNRHLNRLRRNGDPLAGKTPDGEAMRFLEEIVRSHNEAIQCLTWPYMRDPHGYGRIAYKGKQASVCRLVCERRNGPPPTPAHEAAHECGNGHLGCCNPRHLKWKTHAENMEDRVKHGTLARGEISGGAKLTSEQVRDIIRLKGILHTQKIADKFAVSTSTIFNIQAGRSWRHIDAD